MIIARAAPAGFPARPNGEQRADALIAAAPAMPEARPCQAPGAPG
jgi:hypothetical protein